MLPFRARKRGLISLSSTYSPAFLYGFNAVVHAAKKVIIVTNVGAMQDYQKEKQFRKLNAESSDIQINVIRDGGNTTVSKYDLVVGDIVRMSIGDIIEGDGVLLEGFEIDTDESASRIKLFTARRGRRGGKRKRKRKTRKKRK